MRDLAKHVTPGHEAAQKVTSALYQVSNAVSTGRQLASMPEPLRAYELWRTLERHDPQVLNAKHLQDFEYSNYAVIEILSGAVACKGNDLLTSIEQLVGVTMPHFDEHVEGEGEGDDDD